MRYMARMMAAALRVELNPTSGYIHSMLSMYELTWPWRGMWASIAAGRVSPNGMEVDSVMGVR